MSHVIDWIIIGIVVIFTAPFWLTAILYLGGLIVFAVCFPFGMLYEIFKLIFKRGK